MAYLSQPMRNDEAATYLFYVRKPPLYGLVSYTLPNNHILHTLLVSASTFVFGNHPWAIRLPAFIAGVAMIPLTYVVAKRMFDDRTGLIASGLVASSSVLIELSTNARGYTIVAAAFLALLALAQGLTDSGLWHRFALIAALGFFTIPTMLFPFGVVVTWLAARLRRDRAALMLLARAVVRTAVLTVLLYLPALLWTGPRAFFSNRFIQSLPFGAFARALGPSLGETWRSWNRDLTVGGAILFAIFFAIGLARRPSSSLVATTAIWCGALLLIERWVPFHRVWSFLIPVYWIVVAAGIGTVLRRWRSLAAVALAVAIGVTVLLSGSVLREQETGYFPDAERVMMAVRGLGPVAAYNPAVIPMQYYAVLHDTRLSFSKQAPTIVVDTAAGQTLTDVAHRLGRSPDHAQVFRRFPGATVYRTNP